MGIFFKKNEKKMVEDLVATISNLKEMVFDNDYENTFNNDELGDVDKSFLHFSHVFTQLLEEINIDKYKGKIDDKLFLIVKDLYYNLCLFVDGLVKVDEIALGHTRPSLTANFKKTHQVYDYQMDVAGNNIEKLSKKMNRRIKELYPEVEVK